MELSDGGERGTLGEETNYIQHEQWFELERIVKHVPADATYTIIVKGVRIVNSYGRVREVYEDGTYVEVHPGRREERRRDTYAAR